MRSMMLILGVLCMFAQDASARTVSYLEQTFGWKPGDVCTISYNAGGGRFEYEGAAEEVNNGACDRVIVDGPCLSNCTYFLNLVDTTKVCVTPRSIFGFHIGPPKKYPYVVLATKERGFMTMSFSPPYTGRVAQWIKDHGGLTYDWKVMRAQDASLIWKWCPQGGGK